MPAPTKLTPEMFVGLVRQSGLIDGEILRLALREIEFDQRSIPDTTRLADFLVERQLLTRWQADKLLQGRNKGFLLGKYRLLSHLGSGGMSAVYLAEHRLMRRRVAIKVLPKAAARGASHLERFHREAQAVAALDHRNIVRAYDVDQEGDIHFLVMEYVSGRSLQEIVTAEGPIDPIPAAEYIRQAAEGLNQAHKSNLVHRDIKPANLLLDDRGTIKVLDLGLVRFFDERDDSSITRHHDEKVLGTADYLSPEQALDSHSVDIRSDVYSLGCTFYYLLVGQPPFPEGTLASRLLAHQTREPPSLAEVATKVPAGLAAIVRKMMAKRPEDRFQSARDVSQSLADWLRENGGETWAEMNPVVGGAVAVLAYPPSSVPEPPPFSPLVPESESVLEGSGALERAPAADFPGPLSPPALPTHAGPSAEPVAEAGHSPEFEAFLRRTSESSPPPPSSGAPIPGPPAVPPAVSSSSAAPRPVPQLPPEVTPEVPVPVPPVVPRGNIPANDSSVNESSAEIPLFLSGEDGGSSDSEQGETRILPGVTQADPPSLVDDESDDDVILADGVDADPVAETRVDISAVSPPPEMFAEPPPLFVPQSDGPVITTGTPRRATRSARASQRMASPAVAPPSGASASTASAPASESRKRVLWILGANALLALLTIGVWFTWGRGTPQKGQSAGTKKTTTEKTGSGKKTKRGTKEADLEPVPGTVTASRRELKVGPSSEFKTLAAALAEARKFNPSSRSARQIISLPSGTLAERITIDDTWPRGLQIKGEGTMLAPPGAEPVVSIIAGKGQLPNVRLEGVEIDATGKETAIRLAGNLEASQFVNLTVHGFSRSAFALEGVQSFGGNSVVFEGITVRGAAQPSAVGFDLTMRGDQGNNRIRLRGCRLLGPMAAGLRGRDSAIDVDVEETVFHEVAVGLHLQGAAANWRNLLVASNTFYKVGQGVVFDTMPGPATDGLSFFNNLFVESAERDVSVVQGYNEAEFLRMFAANPGGIDLNWTTRMAPTPPVPAEIPSLFEARRGRYGVMPQFISVDPANPDFLRPAPGSPQANVGMAEALIPKKRFGSQIGAVRPR